MAWHNVRRNALMGNDPEKISNTQKTNQRATNETRKEVLKSYADMIIYAIGSARFVQQRATINFLHLLSPR